LTSQAGDPHDASCREPHEVRGDLRVAGHKKSRKLPHAVLGYSVARSRARRLQLAYDGKIDFGAGRSKHPCGVDADVGVGLGPPVGPQSANVPPVVTVSTVFAVRPRPETRPS
jgi:hypothetical protein